MPLPERFFDSTGKEVSLKELCRLEPEWAANQIRTLYKSVDMLTENLLKTLEAGFGAKTIAVHEVNNKIVVVENEKR